MQDWVKGYFYNPIWGSSVFYFYSLSKSAEVSPPLMNTSARFDLAPLPRANPRSVITLEHPIGRDGECNARVPRVKRVLVPKKIKSEQLIFLKVILDQASINEAIIAHLFWIGK
jgi:hypothetical protein